MPSFKKDSSDAIQPIAWRIRGFMPFSRSICPKVNVIVRQEFELAYYDLAVQRFNHYTTATPTSTWSTLIIKVPIDSDCR